MYYIEVLLLTWLTSHYATRQMYLAIYIYLPHQNITVNNAPC